MEELDFVNSHGWYIVHTFPAANWLVDQEVESLFVSGLSGSYGGAFGASAAAQAALSEQNKLLPSLEELERKRTEFADKIKAFQSKAGRKLQVGSEPPRNKTHWDYLLEEMEWMANDFKRERKWQMDQSRKVSRAVRVCGRPW